MALPPLVQIVNHATLAVATLVAQFAESTLLKGLVFALGAEVQAAEDGIWGILVTRNIDQADDAALASIARLVGAPVRGTRTAAQYRLRIKAQILANRSDGSADYMYRIAKLLVPPWNVTGQPRVIEQPIATFDILVDPAGSIVDNDSDVRELARVLDEAAPAGVRVIAYSQTVANSAVFTFAGGTGLGFGSGVFASAYDGKQ